jgi:metal-responsive CopG/Arc/MetJ family transcriptional regulator
MKTAISLPDSLFEDVEEIANDMGIPRSQLLQKHLRNILSITRETGSQIDLIPFIAMK